MEMGQLQSMNKNNNNNKKNPLLYYDVIQSIIVTKARKFKDAAQARNRHQSLGLNSNYVSSFAK